MRQRALIGRSRELAEIEARLAMARLVTLVGPGGVGKTALAQEAARTLGSRFPHGARHVDLTRIDGASGVPGAVAAQLGFDSFDSLLGSLAEQPVLLVVDNCEHVLDAVADTVAHLLGACRQPSVVATSRSPLEVPGESIVVVAPLPLPTGDDPSACPSVELFVARCRESGAVGVGDGDGDVAAVAELCRQLDGLPLALELAAARARTMSVTEISGRLADSVAVLARPRFRGDPRHRSLADTIGWSYDLLAPAVAELLESLAVFAGPFGAAAARAAAPPELHADFHDAFDELVAASLITVDGGAGATSYRLLDTVRTFARDRLERRGADTAAYGRFVDHVADGVRTRLAGAAVRWRSDLIRSLIDSFDDIAEALRWCIAHDPTPTRAHQLCSGLWGVVHQAHADDIVELMRELTQRFPDDSSRGGVHALAVRATAEYVAGRPRAALELVEPLAHRADDLPAVMVHRVLGQARSAVGDRAGALDAFGAGARIADTLDMRAMAHELTVAAAVVTADTGDVVRALAAVAGVVAEADAENSPLSRSWARTVHAWLLTRVDPRAALVAADAALTEAREVSYPIAIAVNQRTQAFARIGLGDLAGAAVTLDGLLDDLVERGALANARVLVDAVAALARTADHPAADTLVATARSLPITTLPSSQFELIPLGDTNAAALPRREVFAAARRVLDELSSTTFADRPERRQGAVRVHGDLCEFEFAGRGVTVRRSKGIADVVRLLTEPGVEVPAVDLAGAGVEQASTGELVDARARREYEDRIRELQADIDAAEADNDYARAYRHQVEFDAIVEHLTAAIGRGGRRRRGADTAERARSAVTHRVRSAIRQLEQVHPALAHHLAHAIQTGTYCSYRPEHPVDWAVDAAVDRAGE